MKILVTGASGYVGSHLVKKLKVCHTLDMIGDVDFNIDIRNQFELEEAYDVVIHLAALVRVGESVENPTDYYETNINGTLNVLKNIKTKKFIFASTGAAVQLNSPYAISKKVCEDIVQEYCTKSGIDYITFRFYNVIGGNPTNPDSLFYALKTAEKRGYINIFGSDYNTIDGTAIRDYVHVDEICESIMRSFDSLTNKIENLGHGKGKSVLELVNLYKSVNNENFDIVFCDRRGGDLEYSVLDEPSKFMVNIYNMNDMLKKN
jgi:UDP-glucose 4-epimerase